ncbi:hypothetical protein C6P46_001076 [Rhodotorula mucilaginosa]|uniref:Uncharacterized protein n=1 Tax=Rhodotorula mucilaginosa TaxID=5537 RepID=A0A9P7B226_RHOMI|nr:hypothetical protein C6P46_001076 [Rhodotorula mucilaginosa]
MFARTAFSRSIRPFTRGYATGEPVNLERGQSRTPFFIGGALLVLAGGYFSGIFTTPPTPAVKNMQKAMHPKTDAAKEAAFATVAATQGIRQDPLDEPHKAGGDLKGRHTVVPAFFFYMFKGILQYTPTSRVLKIRGDCAGEWTG